ncbi:Fe(3+) dicitrate transport protein FecA precursor [compost metagenome]
MKLKDFSFTLTALFFTLFCFSQHTITGKITNARNNEPVPYAEVYNNTTNVLVKANAKGEYIFAKVKPGKYKLTFVSDAFNILEENVELTNQNLTVNAVLQPLEIELSEVVIENRRQDVFGLARLNDIEGTAIYAGKKTEVVILSKQMGNMATNNPRQVFAQVVGLNIYESNDGGLQLNIGGRGLDPNRSSHFNIRQNDYDISADILGYPESYYTPPVEGLDRIQVVRGAASLQYGTQFGGLVNFKMKSPISDRKMLLTQRQTAGSFGLFTNFTSLSGTVGKFSYYTYFNYKQGDGFQDNSQFKSYNYFGNFNYQFTDRTSLGLDYTHFSYLAKQPGGLTDKMFNEDPYQSNRSRNWFDVNWNLFALKFKHKISNSTDFSMNLFSLYAERQSLGFRTNRVFQEDSGGVRDLIYGKFFNWGAETRLLHRYNFFGRENAFVVGAKYYHAENEAKQGPGSSGSDANFSFATKEFPNYPTQSSYDYPNRNLAVFGENIFRLSNTLSVTPGFRFEHINTGAKGFYRRINQDNAGNVIFDETYPESNELKRSFVLLGLGLSYKPFEFTEFYANFSQNYRSVTFSDIRIAEPSYQVDENLKDEKGYTFDMGIRGKLSNKINYDVSVFGLAYNGRLGQVLRRTEDFRIVRYRTNVGDAFMYGLEVFGDWSLQKTFFNAENNDYQWKTFVNMAVTKSEYTKSQIAGVKGNEVEFVPMVNLKTGMSFGYKNFMSSLQFTYLSDQYTDATNVKIDKTDNTSGIEGQIPAYSIVDLSFSYSFYKHFKIETGINNLTDNAYFTRRATGYPGPGIIPSAPRTYYATLQFTF